VDVAVVNGVETESAAVVVGVVDEVIEEVRLVLVHRLLFPKLLTQFVKDITHLPPLQHKSRSKLLYLLRCIPWLLHFAYAGRHLASNAFSRFLILINPGRQLFSPYAYARASTMLY